MTALQKIDYILIKLHYHAYPAEVRYVCPIRLNNTGYLQDVCCYSYQSWLNSL